MISRKTLFTLTLAEGATLWLAIVLGTALVEDHGTSRSAQLLLGRGLAVAVICVAAMYLADLYDIVKLRRAASFAERLPRALGVALVLFGIFYAVLPSARLHSATLIPCVAAGMCWLFLVRAALGRVLRRGQPERVLVLGEAPLVARVVDAVGAKRSDPLIGEQVIVGVVDLISAAQGGYRSFDDMVHSAQPDRIVVATLDRRLPLPVQQLLEGRLHGIAVEDWVPFYERVAGKIAVEALNPGSVAFGDGFGEPRIHAAFASAVGVIAAFFGLLVLAPLLALLALAIKLGSPGPAFFVQPRVGLHGRPYGLIKLRTMYVTDTPPSEWAKDNAARVTPLGRWLRRFRIDELPQLINVLKRDMNLVGPRPHPVSNYALFMERIPYYALRSVVRPGITGWAQVRYGYANDLEQEIEKMRFDLFYIRNVSIWLDLRVLLETVGVVVRGHEQASVAAPPVLARLSRTLT